MSVYSVLVSGLPESATMGGVENLIYDKTTGRIVAITLQGAGTRRPTENSFHFLLHY